MSDYAVLAFKNPKTGAWIDNLQNGGVKVRAVNSKGKLVWITMTTLNTFVKNPDADTNPAAPAWTTVV
jgi:hypothetical protein